MRLHVLLASLILSCGSPETAPPRVLSFAPGSVVEGASTTLTVELAGQAPFVVDYGSDAVQIDGDVKVRFGTLVLGADRLPGTPNQVSVGIPPTLSPGNYALEIELPDGRLAAAPVPFTVAPSPVPLRYTLAPIADQKKGTPFEITIRAEGGAASTFTGTVALDANPGTLSPRRTGNFAAGVRVETVRVTAVDEAMVIVLTDDDGHSTTSNPFRVSN